MNMWHHIGVAAGDDLVLRMKLMPLCPYTLNHYYKGVKRQSWGSTDTKYVWQLVPDKFHLEPPSDEEKKHTKKALASFTDPKESLEMTARNIQGKKVYITADTPWQELGYWHIGRAQIMSGKYGVEEYWHNDLANGLRTNHLDMTLQPVFSVMPRAWRPRVPVVAAAGLRSEPLLKRAVVEWQPKLSLERLPCRPPPERRVEDLERLPRRTVPPPPSRRVEEPRWDEELALPAAPPAAPPPPPAEEDLGLDLLAGPGPLPPVEEPRAPPVAKRGGRGKKGGAAVGGTLLRPDGSSEASMVGLL